MHILNRIFDKIYVISIPRNKQRLDDFYKRTQGIEIELFTGVDGKRFFPEFVHITEFPQPFFKEHNLVYDEVRIFNKGQLGCAMSHINIQREIIRLKLKKVLILEDDTFILSGQLKYFEEALRELPDDWELFYLGYTNVSRWVNNPLSKILLEMKYKLKPAFLDNYRSDEKGKMFLPKSFSKHLFTPGIYTGTHAYAISGSGAQKIVDYSSPIKYLSDMALMYGCYNKIVKGFALKKPLFTLEPGAQSTLW
jgi:glycosyl transferase family 25